MAPLPELDLATAEVVRRLPAEPPAAAPAAAPAPVAQPLAPARIEPAPVVSRPAPANQAALTNQWKRLDSFHNRIQKLIAKENPAPSEAMSVFGASKTERIREIANRMHAEVDELLAAKLISGKEAGGYHNTISIGESVATNSRRTRDWTASEPAAAPGETAAAAPETPAPAGGAGEARAAVDEAPDYAEVPATLPPMTIEETVATASSGDGPIATISTDTPRAWEARNWTRYSKRVAKNARAYFKEHRENLQALVERRDPQIEYFKSLGYKFRVGKRGRIEVDVPPVATQAASINGQITKLVSLGVAKESEVLRPATLYVKTPLIRRWRKNYLAVDIGAEVPPGYKPVKTITWADRNDAMASGNI